MITVYNIRGTNGSGKSTLARSFIGGDPAAPPNVRGDENSPNMVDLAHFSSPTKKDPGRLGHVEGYVSSDETLGTCAIVVGSYRTACGGLDAVPSFDLSFQAIRHGIDLLGAMEGGAEHRAVICEGVISSTVWGSWGTFAGELAETVGARMAFCYLDTPLEVCLERIRKRQEAAGKVRDIKTELVADKVKAVAATRRRALEAGHTVYDLPYETAETALKQIIYNGPVLRDRRPGAEVEMVPARERYLARA